MLNIEIHKGDLLVAEPSILNDQFFNRALILITEHTAKNSVGFILNKPLEYTLQDVVPSINCNFTLYNGGPVEEDNLYFIHKAPHLLDNSIEVANGIYWGGNFAQLTALLNSNSIRQTDIRFFLGYSGWQKNQLKEELIEKSWFIDSTNTTEVFKTNTKDFWKEKLLQKGGNYKIWANAPKDYNLN